MSSAESVLTPNQVLEQMERSGQDRFDPVNFKYAQALLEKATAARPAVAHQLESKAAEVLKQYQERLAKTKPNAQQQVSYLSKHGFTMVESEESEMDYDFRALALKVSRLERKLKRQKAIKSLTGLFSDIEEDPLEQEQLSFDDLLLDHERTTIRNLVGEVEENQSPQHENQFDDLKSHKLFKDSWVKIHAENLVSEAIEEAPKDAGPLNSHMLAIKSIEAMKNLSPEYLNRFVSYMDSLLWLEKIVEQEMPAGKQPRKTKKR